MEGMGLGFYIRKFILVVVRTVGGGRRGYGDIGEDVVVIF